MEEKDMASQGSGNHLCADAGPCPHSQELSLIREMAAASVKWDEENLAAIPDERADEPSFSVGKYWRDRLSLSRSWKAFCADPVNHPGLRNMGPSGRESVVNEILSERTRQMSVHGWYPEHDDIYRHHELVRAAETYLEAGRLEAITEAAHTRLLSRWPWAASWFKPRDARRNLIKAAALIVAEIERIDRSKAALSPAEPTGGESHG